MLAFSINLFCNIKNIGLILIGQSEKVSNLNNMNWGNILGIAGIIATIFIGYRGIIIAKAGNKISLSFIEKQFIPLFKTIIKNFESLELRYKSQSITEKLVLIKATLVNDGNIDLDKSIIFKPVTISLPHNFKLIEHTLTEKSENVNAQIDVKGNDIVIQWDLLKKHEFISLDLLVEISSTQDFNVEDIMPNLEYYNIDQRITNLNQVNKYAFDFSKQEKITFSKIFNNQIVPYTYLLIGIIMGVYILLSPSVSYKYYFFVGSENKQNKISLNPISLNEVRIKSKIDSLNFAIPINELKDRLDINIGVVKSNYHLYFYLIFYLVIATSGVLLLIIRKRPEKEKRLRKILNNRKQEKKRASKITPPSAYIKPKMDEPANSPA